MAASLSLKSTEDANNLKHQVCSPQYFPPYSLLGFDLRTADEAQSWEDREQPGASMAALTLPACRADSLRGAPAPAHLPLLALAFWRVFTPQERCQSKAAGQSHS